MKLSVSIVGMMLVIASVPPASAENPGIRLRRWCAGILRKDAPSLERLDSTLEVVRDSALTLNEMIRGTLREWGLASGEFYEPYIASFEAAVAEIRTPRSKSAGNRDLIDELKALDPGTVRSE